MSPGFSFGPDTHWQQEFEDAFPFEETADQLRAIAETKQDMESERPMDRLICGDVGFGKTEVAIRAVFKAIMSGKQAALMAPTTVLAQQHYQTLRERMSDYPVTIELLSRYRTAAEQKRVIIGLADGSIDVVVGTHRLVSSDVRFKDIGLLVVDEEQRFGVKHKELLKDRFRQVDVLTLSATPIPRTLYLSLMGARDMSLIETPPPNRQPVETIVSAYDERIFRDAIQRELVRGGQVYFLHNRVQTIERVAKRICELCPGARVVIGHGQMSEHELESVMRTFVAGDCGCPCFDDDNRERLGYSQCQHNCHRPCRSLWSCRSLPASGTGGPIADQGVRLPDASSRSYGRRPQTRVSHQAIL